MMDAIRRNSRFSVKHPQDIHPDRRNPRAVLKRFQKALRNEDIRAIDEAWIVVDVDEWDSDELRSLFTWASQDNRCHVAISNPKFELYVDKAGEFRFRLKARNGEVIAASEGYKAKASCLNGIESVRKNAVGAAVVKEAAK